MDTGPDVDNHHRQGNDPTYTRYDSNYDALNPRMQSDATSNMLSDLMESLTGYMNPCLYEILADISIRDGTIE